MIEIIKKILESNKNIDAYKIIEKSTESNELFFIKKDVDMNRSKKVYYYVVTVYSDFEEDGKKYRGASTCNVYPTMKQNEIEDIIQDAAYSSKFVKNPYFILAKPVDNDVASIKSNFSTHPLPYWMSKLTEAIYKNDNYKNGFINSAELFLNKTNTRIINSEGVDVKFQKYHGQIEVITNWKENNEEIELYKNIDFSDFEPDVISNCVYEMLKLSREKALANTTVKSSKYNVLLTGECLKEILSYYVAKANCKSVYENISELKIGENVQGKEVIGDSINMKINPFMKNSSKSVPFDNDGCKLEKVELYNNGVLKNYFGDVQFSHYMNVKPTGTLSNIEIKGGLKGIDEFKTKPYVELVSFSDFQLDPLTGDFGGEIRLGWYFDGNKKTPITGGSISGNMIYVQKEMYLSKELQKVDNWIMPKTIQLFNVTISGK